MSQFLTLEIGQALFNESQDALFLFDPETEQVLDVNQMAQRMSGFPQAELRKFETGYLFRFEAQGDRNRIRQAAHQTMAFNAQEGFLLRTNQDGVWVPVNLTITRLHVRPKTLGLIAARDISDQRQARSLLQRTEAELRRVVASITDCLWSADLDGKGQWGFRYFSPVVHQLAGRPPEYFLATIDRWAGVVHPDDRPRWQQALGRLQSGQSSREEQQYRVLRTDGTIRWVRDSVNATRGTGTRAARLDGVITDITDRLRAEDALQRERYLFNTLLENVPDTVYFKDQSSRFIRVNQALADRFGLASTEDAIGKNDFHFFTLEHAQPAYLDEQEVMRTGNPLVDKEEREFWPDGHITWVSTTKMPLRDREGNIIGTFGISRDITARKRAEEILADSERRYRTLTEAALDAIVVADQRGNISLFNRAAERIFGYEAAEVLGQPIRLLVPEEYRELHDRGLGRYIDSRQPRMIGKTVELSGRKKDGSEFPMELSLSAIDLGGELQFLATMRDVTERNRMRSVLTQSEKLASIGLLSAGVAHEINNPLAYVANNLAVLERDTKGVMELLDVYEAARSKLAEADPAAAARVTELAEEVDLTYVRENLDRMFSRTREGVHRVAKIVQSLRSLARTAPPQREKASIADLIDMSVEMVKVQSQRRGIGIQLDCPPDLPPLWCVPTQISQVLLNLLINALQACEATGRTEGESIRITARQAGQELLIEVADNGVGIPEADLARIFDPFFTTKPVGEGTGLGLSISHGIVTGHGGRIEVDSRPGDGTRFRMLLPLTPPRGAT